MEVFAHFRKVSAGINQAFGEISRVTRGKTQAFDPLDVMHVVKEIREGVLASALGGDAW
jgi:hypothetical protein